MVKGIDRKILAYISHPSSGLLDNTLDTEVIIKLMYMNDDIYNKMCLVSPIHAYGFMYNDFEYNKSLSLCTDLLLHCDIMLVFGDWENSTGCKEEVALCKKIGLPYIIVGKSDELQSKIADGLLEKITNLVE